MMQMRELREIKDNIEEGVSEKNVRVRADGMRVLLINPPAPAGVRMVREGRCMQREGAWGATWPPISLAYIASVLLKEGFDCRLHDCIVENIDINPLLGIFDEYNPEIVVINTATPSIDSDILVGRLIKKKNKNVKLIYFGIHVTALAKEILEKNKFIDFIVKAEPEFSVRDICTNLRDVFKKKGISRESFDVFGRIKNIAYTENGRVIETPAGEMIKDLDILPFPAWHLVKIKKYITPIVNRPFLMIATNRGCPYNCTYCADHVYYGKKLRSRNPKKVAEEMIWVKKTFGVYDFLFWSEGFTMNKEYAKEICREIIKAGEKTGEKFSWVANGRIGDVDEELLNLMKKAGCWMIGYGVESGVQEILNNVRKGITLKQTADTIKMTKKAGIKVTGHFILGLPGDTKETILKTIEFAKRMPIDFAQFYCSVPFPGSELYRNVLKEGRIINRDWRFFEQNYSVLNYPELKAEEVMLLRKRAYREFYLRPKMILNTLCGLRNFGQLVNFMKMGLGFLDWVKSRSV